MYKKLVCFISETDFNQLKKTSLLKRLCGEDKIGFEYKNKNPFEDKNYAKLIINTNNLPPTSDKTIGYYRRWLITDFSTSFTEEKEILDEIPDIEYNNLALKSVRILKELLDKRKFHNEGNIEFKEKAYEKKSNPLNTFIEEMTIEDLDSQIPKDEFLIELNKWCKKNKFRKFYNVSIGKLMKELGYSQGLDSYGEMGKTKRLRVWWGIRWK